MNHTLLLLMMCLSQTGAAQELPGLILHAKMENSCQLTDELEGSPANGVMVDVSPAPNKNNTPNTAVAFNQNTSYISLGVVEKLKLPGDKSFSFWIKPTVTGTDITGSVFSYGTAIVIGYQEQTSVPKLNISFGNTLYLQTNLTTEWQAVTIIFSKDYSSAKSKVALYVDGVFKAESEQSKTAQNFNSALAIMGVANPVTPINGFRGVMDDFKMYNRALAATEVLNAALPVALESFTGKRINGVIQLQWKTSMEQNVSHFDIQRSADGIIFQTISRTLAGKFNYETSDNSASSDADFWYRLQIVDKDGKSEYSNVIKVGRDTTVVPSGLIIFPNPASTTINFKGDIKKHVVKIISLTGTLVRHQLLTNKINITDLRPGMYYVVIYDDMGNKKVVSKFIKKNER